MNTPEHEGQETERLRRSLIADLAVLSPREINNHWAQTGWKPNLKAMAAQRTPEGRPSPLAFALGCLAPEQLARADEEADPFRYILESVNPQDWAKHRCEHSPFLTRIWLAAASHLRADITLIFKAHGWKSYFLDARKTADVDERTRLAHSHFFAMLRNADEHERKRLLGKDEVMGRIKWAENEGDEAFLRRLERAENEKEKEKTSQVQIAEKFLVQFWLEFPNGGPGLCFFQDSALDELLKALNLRSAMPEDDNDPPSEREKAEATKKLRMRLGLIQAGYKRHLIEEVQQSSQVIRLLHADNNEVACIRRMDWHGETRWPRFRQNVSPITHL